MTNSTRKPSSILIFNRIMPSISIFFGIVIRMYYNDHEPGHFHAEYQGKKAIFNFSGKMLLGNIRSKVALQLIKKWANLHKVELEQNWQRARAKKALKTIKPLE